MFWLLLASTAGLGDALRDAASKRYSQHLPPLIGSLSYSLLPSLFMILPLLSSIPEKIPDLFLPSILTSASIHLLGGVLLVRALSKGELSLSIPMVAFTPVFLLFVGPIITGELPAIKQIFGSLLVVLGSYLLNLSHVKAGLLAPFKALFSHPSPRLMLILAFLWSITGSIDRRMLKELPVFFWGSSQMIIITLGYIAICYRTGDLRSLKKPLIQKQVAIVGAGNLLSFITYLFALTMAPVYLVVCVKRLNIIFSILLGKHLFQEVNVTERLFGGMLMILGIALICVP